MTSKKKGCVKLKKIRALITSSFNFWKDYQWTSEETKDAHARNVMNHLMQSVYTEPFYIVMESDCIILNVKNINIFQKHPELEPLIYQLDEKRHNKPHI